MLLWADPFDQYGGDTAFMRDGVYAHVGGIWELSTAKPRTGLYSLYMDTDTGGGSNQSINNEGALRRIFGAPKATAGVAYALWIERLPPLEMGYSGIVANVLGSFLDAAGQTQVHFVLGTDGGILIYRGYTWEFNGGVGTLLYRTNPCIRARSYNHLEFKVTADNAAGAVEVRCNGVTVANLTNVDTVATSNVEVSQFIASFGDSLNPVGDLYLSDLQGWDGTGDDVNDFVGDQKAFWLGAVGDTAQADFTPSAGATSYGVVDEAPPDESDYLSLAASTGKTELALADLPADVVSVVGVIPLLRAWKSDAGACDMAPGVKSGSSYSTPNGQPITTEANYYWEPVVLDPDTSAPFTLAAVNALRLVIERTA